MGKLIKMDVKVGDKVSWQATAKFSGASGSGERIDGRKCDLKFARKPSPDAAPGRPAAKG